MKKRSNHYVKSFNRILFKIHIGDVNEDILSPLAAAGATIKAKIEVN